MPAVSKPFNVYNEWFNNPFRIYNIEANPALIKKSVLSAGSADILEPPTHHLDCNVPPGGQNDVIVYGEFNLHSIDRPDAGALYSKQFLRFPMRIAALVTPNGPTANLTATSYCGIGIGYPDILLGDQPFPDPATAPFIHLRCRYDTRVWQLAFGDPAFGSNTVIVLPAAVTALGIPRLCELFWYPGPNDNSMDGAYIEARIDGEFQTRQTSPGVQLPDKFGATWTNAGPNYIITCGSAANSLTTAYIGPFLVQQFDRMKYS